MQQNNMEQNTVQTPAEPMPAVPAPIMDEQTKLARRRNKVIAWLLIIFGVLNLFSIPAIIKHNVHGPELIDQIFNQVVLVPQIVLIVFLFKQKNVLNWV